MAHFSLSWDAYKQSICTGLSALQQNGEFVDMTLAADGHHVKVHQMIMCLVSPYIKELISSAQCPHPVIFLNKISYSTLCSILEYVYTGEVLVAKEHLTALIEAGKELHIKGLEDMRIEVATNPKQLKSQSHSMHSVAHENEGQSLSESTGYFIKQAKPQQKVALTQRNNANPSAQEEILHTGSLPTLDEIPDHTYEDEMEYSIETENTSIENEKTSIAKLVPDTQIQFTISNQGALQMILNRFMYNLRYTSRKGGSLGHRHWRCVSYTRGETKCPASVITKDEVVVKRYGAHNHPFHDQKILKKVRDNAVFTAIHDAEKVGNQKKLERNITTPSKATDKYNNTIDTE